MDKDKAKKNEYANLNIIKLDESVLNNSMNSLFEKYVGKIFKSKLIDAIKDKNYQDKIKIEHLKHYKFAITQEQNDSYEKRKQPAVTKRQDIARDIKKKLLKNKVIDFNTNLKQMNDIEFDHAFLIYDMSDYENEITLKVNFDEKTYKITTPALIVLEVTLDCTREQFERKIYQIYKQIYVLVDRNELLLAKFDICQEFYNLIKNGKLKVFPMIFFDGILKTQYSNFNSLLYIQDQEYFKQFDYSNLLQMRKDYIEWGKDANADAIHKDYKDKGQIDVNHLKNIYSQELVYKRLTDIGSQVENIVKNNEEFVKKHQEDITKIKEDITKIKEDMAKHQEDMANNQEELVEKHQEDMTKIKEHMTKNQEELIKKHEELIKKHEEDMKQIQEDVAKIQKDVTKIQKDMVTNQEKLVKKHKKLAKIQEESVKNHQQGMEQIEETMTEVQEAIEKNKKELDKTLDAIYKKLDKIIPEKKNV